MLKGRDIFCRKLPRHDPMPRVQLLFDTSFLMDFPAWLTELIETGGTPYRHEGSLSMRDYHQARLLALQPWSREAQQPSLHLLGMEMMSRRAGRDLQFKCILEVMPGQVEWTRYILRSERELLDRLEYDGWGLYRDIKHVLCQSHKPKCR